MSNPEGERMDFSIKPELTCNQWPTQQNIHSKSMHRSLLTHTYSQSESLKNRSKKENIFSPFTSLLNESQHEEKQKEPISI
jgi:hypothetical protein